MTTNKGKIGLWTSIALVTGNMIGSGIFLLPSTLASFGGISIIGWLLSAAGAILLAKVFSYLSQMIPSTGGPYAYSKAGFGDFAGFIVAWGYWISIWCGNAAMAVALIGYLGVFFPSLVEQPMIGMIVGQCTIWFLVWLNAKGIKEAGKIQVVTTVLKLLPILSIAIFGMVFINMDHFTPFNLSEESSLKAITITAAITLWAFLGVESATIPAGDIKDPKTTIPKATLIGTLIATIAYIMSSVAIMGMIPAEALQSSTAPFADAAFMMWGTSGKYIVALGAVISCFGALNGWTIMLGQIPLAAADDKLFPRIFGRVNKNNVPITGIIISTILISILIFMSSSGSLVEQFEFIILLATLTCLIPYIFSTAGFVIISIERKLTDKNGFGSKLAIAILAFIYSFWAIIGSGSEVVFWGFLLIIAGIPFYVLIQWNKSK